MKIAIDGPAGAGKSTVARKLARELGILYIDTGAMYRALTWKGLQLGIDLDDPEQLHKLAISTRIDFTVPAEGEMRVFCDGLDVTEAIRAPRVSQWVSVVAADPRVREIMVRQQQEIAQRNDVVMDGRDITHCVLPDADYKFFLTADLEERVRRRKKELEEKGYQIDEAALRKEIQERDYLDENREVGALKIVPEAIVVDTSHMSWQEVMNRILEIIREGRRCTTG